MVTTRHALAGAALDAEARRLAGRELQLAFERDWPVEWDWLRQDAGRSPFEWFAPGRSTDFELKLLRKAIEPGLPEAGVLRAAQEKLQADAVPAGDPAWLELYVRACAQRREQRLATARRLAPRFVFARHYNLGGSHYAYTEGLSDAQNERHFEPGTALGLYEFNDTGGKVTPLIEDAQGVIRDPDVSWDGRRILFAWKKADLTDDYHLYEYDVDTAKARQLTFGVGVADYEGAYLPEGGLVFNSTRCVQTVDCWWTEVSNLYTADAGGGRIRRLTFDQVHDNYPTVLADGRVVYTRWEYSDRGQIFVQGLFQMQPDGTGQTEYYGNNAWFPTSLLHARGIPGRGAVMAILAGHHTLQAGKLAVVDPRRGRQENQGVQLIAPVRPTAAERVDAYGQAGELFQYPYPLTDDELLVGYSPEGWNPPAHFVIYWFHVDGRRELLVADPEQSCSQPVPLVARPRPASRPSHLNVQQETGVYLLRDIYQGPGLKGVPRGTVRKLRVVALGYRAAGIGYNYNHGPAGDALASTPVSVGNGAWDVKIVLGDAEVYPDGSACFVAPARTPLYFQAIDDRGYAVQSMRSWSTLQPGEIASCVGCHESKNQAPVATGAPTLAGRAGPQPLTPFLEAPHGFSFAREIQPILDRHCIRCHRDSAQFAARLVRPALVPPHLDEVTTNAPAGPAVVTAGATGDRPLPREERVAFSLLDRPVVEARSARRWTEAYLALTQARQVGFGGEETFAGVPNDTVNWISAQSVPELLPPYHRGAARSRLMTLLAQGHGGVELSRKERETIACWIDLLVPFCGEYTEAGAWSGEQQRTYLHFLEKRETLEGQERETLEALKLEARRALAAPPSGPPR